MSMKEQAITTNKPLMLIMLDTSSCYSEYLNFRKIHGQFCHSNETTEVKFYQSISIISRKVNYQQCTVCFIMSRSYKLWLLVIFQDIGTHNHSRLIKLFWNSSLRDCGDR